MPKIFMEKLGLKITKPYHDLYSFESRKVKCEGLIKDMVATLAQLHVKIIMMDVVVAYVPVGPRLWKEAKNEEEKIKS
jgi:hypothetical protein